MGSTLNLERASVSRVMQANGLRQLRIELGQTQDAVIERALASGRVRSTFTRIVVAKAEAPKPSGLRSHDVRVALAEGLGLPIHELDAFLAGQVTVSQAVGRSSIRPDPAVVERLRQADMRREAKASEHEAARGSDKISAVLRLAELEGLPDGFIREFERAARREQEDRAAFEWFDEMRAQARAWLRRNGLNSDTREGSISPQHPRDTCSATRAESRRIS